MLAFGSPVGAQAAISGGRIAANFGSFPKTITTSVSSRIYVPQSTIYVPYHGSDPSSSDEMSDFIKIPLEIMSMSPTFYLIYRVVEDKRRDRDLELGIQRVGGSTLFLAEEPRLLKTLASTR